MQIDKIRRTNMRNICILKLEKNENGFYIAGQTAESACLRSWLKLNGINSMIDMDDTLPSLNDLAEDVLSVCEDILAIYINEENKKFISYNYVFFNHECSNNSC